MTKPFPYLIFLIVLFAGISGCSKKGVDPVTKPASDLPAATQTGANMMAWHTDGIPFIANGISSVNVVVNTDKNSPYYNDGSFVIVGFPVAKTGYEQGIVISSPSGPVTFPIQPGTTFKIESHTQNFLAEHTDQGTGTTSSNLDYNAQTGQIIVTLYDPAKRILAGTFSFSTDPAAGSVRKITDGWFDVKY